MMMNEMMTENNETSNSTSSAYDLKLRSILTATDAPTTSDTLQYRKWFLQQFIQDKHQTTPATVDCCDCSLERFAVYFMFGIRRHGNKHLRTNEYTENECIKKDDIITTKTTIATSTTTTYQHKKPLRGGSNSRSENSERMAFPMLGTPIGRSFTSVQPRNASTPVRKNLNNSHHYHHQQQQHHQVPKHAQQLQTGQNQRRSADNCNKSFGATSNISSFDKSRNSTTGDLSSGSNSICLGDFLTSPTTVSGNRHTSAQKKKKHSSSTTQTTANSTSLTNNLNINTNSSTNIQSKPKKRVVPISVSQMSTKAVKDKLPFGTHSSFSQENNILSLTQIESKEFNKCAVAEARQALKNELSEVSSVIKATPTSTPSRKGTSIEKATSSMKNLNISGNQIEAETETPYPLQQPQGLLDKIPNEIAKQLQVLACIYGLLIDMNMNLTTDVLNEISFLLNLLNAEIPLQNNDTNDGFDDDTCAGIDLLKIGIFSIYFAKCALEEQEQTLSLIDIKSLGVILQCERLQYLTPSLNHYLTAVYAQKQTFSTTIALHDVVVVSYSSGLKNVCFQEDTDSRKFFHSNNEFGAFKTQRDLFYNALKYWEKHHLYPQFIFAMELAPKVRDIFRQSENSVNMTHFSKLFVSQLLISATEQTSPEEVGIGMKDDIDLEKFNKLSQRLVAPSEFSVDFQFPREQAFFRDFIIESRSLAFIEHLKLILYSELIALNDSTFEHINIHSEDGYHHQQPNQHRPHQREYNEEESEFIVRPPILGSMLILAKFLGFVTSLPFQGSTDVVQSQQLRLRRRFQPTFNICQIIETAIKNKRHLITIPWIVQYLYMLDDVTLQLDGFVEATNKLFTLYASLGNGELKINPTSAFIVRCCLGWLFEKHYTQMAYKYLCYRIEEHSKHFNHFIAMQNQRRPNELQMKPILDATMCVACPFLAEFRVSIMPPKYAMAKYVSRTGRFRHITPCFAAETPQSSNELRLNAITTLSVMNDNGKPIAMAASTATASENLTSNSHTIPQQRQKMLMESFLHAQNTSMRRLIFFLTERVYKCVVKDAQNQILLPLKADADKQANKIISIDKNMVYEQVSGIYQYARSEARKQWDTQIPEMINKRTTLGLEHLLPNETATIIKKAYAWRIRSEAKLKISQWMHMNLYENDYYCSDMKELALKISKSNKNRNKNANASSRTETQAQTQTQTTELKLLRSQPRISDLIEELQHWLYTTGFQTPFQPEIFSKSSSDNIQDIQTSFGKHDASLIDFLERLKSSFDNILPTMYYRLIGAGLVQLLQHLILISPLSMTNELIQAACEFFSYDRIREADILAPPPILRERQTDKTDEDNISTLDADNSEPLSPTKIAATADNGTGTCTGTTATIYHTLISAPFIESLGTCRVRFDKFKDLLIALIQSNVVTLNFINDLFVIVFKEDLSSGVLNKTSNMLRELAQKSLHDVANDESDDLKSKLFMEMLADLSRDIEDF